MQSSFTSWLVSFLILCLSSFSNLASARVGMPEWVVTTTQTTYTIDSYEVEEDKNVCPTHGERQGYGENVQSARCNRNAFLLDDATFSQLLSVLYNSPFPFYAALDSHTDTHHLHRYLRKHQTQDALYIAFCDLRN